LLLFLRQAVERAQIVRREAGERDGGRDVPGRGQQDVEAVEWEALRVAESAFGPPLTGRARAPG
jgi:hypothetical protein